MLTQWSRFPNLPADWNRLREEMERALTGGNGTRIARPATYPALNLWETDEQMFVEAEIPGLELSDLEIFVNGGDQLTIQGERKQPNDEKGTWHRQECGYGKFSRMVQLPSDVNVDGVTAEFINGVLTVTLPKKEDAKPRRIEVKSK